MQKSHEQGPPGAKHEAYTSYPANTWFGRMLIYAALSSTALSSAACSSLKTSIEPNPVVVHEPKQDRKNDEENDDLAARTTTETESTLLTDLDYCAEVEFSEEKRRKQELEEEVRVKTLELRKLLMQGEDIDMADKEGVTRLMKEVQETYQNTRVVIYIGEKGPEEGAEVLEDQEKLRECDWKKVNIEVVKYLVENGADINAEDKMESTVLSYASGNPHAIQYLLSRGADVKARDSRGRTVLHRGIIEPKTYALLIAGGADISARDNEEMTPLMHVVRQHSYYPNIEMEKLQILLAAGADVNAVDKHGMTPLMHGGGDKYIQQETRSGLREYLRRDSTILSSEGYKFLISTGAEVNARDKLGMTPLMHMVDGNYSEDNAETIKLLVAAGADVNAKDNERNTALMHAADYSASPETLERLIEHGADVNAVNKDKQTALMKCADLGDGGLSLDHIETLINHSADINATDNNGKTLLDYVISWENGRIRTSPNSFDGVVDGSDKWKKFGRPSAYLRSLGAK